MWYEALPPFIIMAGCITVTGYGLKIIDKLFLEGKVSVADKSCVCLRLFLSLSRPF